MKTLGIDLASDPAKTGVCVVTRVVGEAVVEKLEVGADDDNVLEVHRRVDVTGIDVPFERMLVNETSRWAGPWSAERRDELRFRQTDFMVREFMGRWPLSVSSDLIAVPTMRCVGLLEKMGVTDRSGDGRVFETYPACALQRWGFRSTGYKGAKKRTVREKLWSKLENRMPWLRFSDP